LSLAVVLGNPAGVRCPR